MVDMQKLMFKEKRIYLAFGIGFLFVATIVNPISGFLGAIGAGLLIRYVLDKFGLSAVAAQQDVIKTMIEAQKHEEEVAKNEQVYG